MSNSGIHLTENFRDNVNRFQKVPAIVDNGFQLSESVAIFRYLARTHDISDPWYSKNDQTRARIDEYLEWQHTNIRQTCTQFFILAYLKQRTIGSSPDDAYVIASAQKQMSKSIDELENLWLKPKLYISGTDQLSFADVLAACELEQTSNLCGILTFIRVNFHLFLIFFCKELGGYDPTEGRPNVTEWLKNVRDGTNPVYDEAHDILNQQLAKL